MRPGLLALALSTGCGLVGCGNGGAVPDVEDTAPPTFAPVIVSIDRVACTTDPVAGEVWQMDLTVSDPQGAATVASGDVSVRNRAGGEIGSYTLACNDETCIGSFRADYDNVDCALAGTLVFVFTVTDETGLVSASMTYES
jgi:hypothetical protein